MTAGAGELSGNAPLAPAGRSTDPTPFAAVKRAADAVIYLLAAWLGLCPPQRIPEVKTLHVKLDAAAALHREPFHDEFVGGDNPVARITRLAMSGSAPHARILLWGSLPLASLASMRSETRLSSAESVQRVNSCVGVAGPHARFTGVSTNPKAGVQASRAYHIGTCEGSQRVAPP